MIDSDRTMLVMPGWLKHVASSFSQPVWMTLQSLTDKSLFHHHLGMSHVTIVLKRCGPSPQIDNAGRHLDSHPFVCWTLSVKGLCKIRHTLEHKQLNLGTASKSPLHPPCHLCCGGRCHRCIRPTAAGDLQETSIQTAVFVPGLRKPRAREER